MWPVRCQRGSAAVETVVSITSLATLVSLGLLIVYSTFAHVWLDRAAYEALVCLSTKTSVFDCESRLRADSERALPVGQLAGVRLDRSPSKARVELKFQLQDRVITRLKQSLRLPLASSAPSLAGRER